MNIKRYYRKQLKGLINRCSLYRWLRKNTSTWTPQAIIEPNLVSFELLEGYEKVEFNEVKEIDHYYHLELKLQVNGNGEEVSGLLLFPLKDGSYFKVSYNCC